MTFKSNLNCKVVSINSCLISKAPPIGNSSKYWLEIYLVLPYMVLPNHTIPPSIFQFVLHNANFTQEPLIALEVTHCVKGHVEDFLGDYGVYSTPSLILFSDSPIFFSTVPELKLIVISYGIKAKIRIPSYRKHKEVVRGHPTHRCCSSCSACWWSTCAMVGG